MTEAINFRRIFLIALIASVAISAVLGIGVILLGNFGYIEIRVLMTTFTITVMSICGLACGAYLEQEPGRILPKVGIGLSLIAALMALLIIWDVLDDSEEFIKSFVTATILAVACSHLSLLSLARLDRRFAWTRLAAWICIWSLSAILIFIIWVEPASTSDLIYRVIGVLAILIASITVITPVLHKLSSDRSDVEKIDAEIEDLERRLSELREQRERLEAENS
ncbi:MAG TPA: bZIP transcription factor [Pyrinomonadaceae bacterium]|nr:bZIP transcription factor [Pyrinomonadaceae bacterium]